MTFANKWVIITGASSGFGAATAKLFGADGAKLILGARRLDRLHSVAAECQAAGAKEVHVHFLDVGQTKSVDEFSAWIRSLASQIDILVNNAGGAHGLDTVATAKD